MLKRFEFEISDLARFYGISIFIFDNIIHFAFKYKTNPGQDIRINLFHLILVPFIHHFKSGIDFTGKMISGHPPRI